MLPRRSKRVKTAHEVASKPKAKAASKSKNAKTALKAKDGKKAKPHPNAKKFNTQPASPEIRNGRGALRDLLEMPMDIICEVFYRLRPLELLRVARINKAFRSLLMHRSSTHIWKEARNSMPSLPEPFPGMSEPAFAALCFDSYCHLCSRPQIRDVVWEFCMRLCNQCKDTKTTLYQRPTPQCPVRPPVMTAVFSKGSRRSVLTSEAQETADKWKQLTDEKEKKKFIAKRKSQIEELERHAAKRREWFMNFKRDRAQEIEMIKKQRYDELEKIGYEDDVAWVQYSGYALDTVAVFREAKHVTDQVWANIKPTVTKYFNNHIRPRRVADEYFAFLEHSMPSLRKAKATFARSYGNIFPLCANFANSSEVRELLDPTSEDDIDVDFDLLIPVLPKILDDWRQNVDRRLDTYLRSQISEVPSKINVRDLAVAHILRCRDCRQLVPSTGVMPAIHDCSQGVVRFKEWLGDSDDPYVQALVKLDVKSWHPGNYYVMYTTLERILAVCGQDRLITVRELDRLDPRLSCNGCRAYRRPMVCRWREAVVHMETEWHPSYGSGKTSLWEVLSEEEVKKLAPLDRAADEDAIRRMNLQPFWWCQHCETHGLNRNDMAQHVRDQHDIANPSDTDFFSSPNKPISAERVVYVD